MNGEEGKFEPSAVPPILRLPNEMIINILSYCDHHSLVNAMEINQTWRECGEYLINQPRYWRKRCTQNIPRHNFTGPKWKETRYINKFKYIYLKWTGWKNLKNCPNCTNHLNILRPVHCAVHETTVSRTKSRVCLRNFRTSTRTHSFNIGYNGVEEGSFVRLHTVMNQQVFHVSISSSTYTRKVNNILPAVITSFLNYYGIFFVGLQNGLVFAYNVKSWMQFDLTAYDMKITGICEEIVSFAVEERGFKRILYIATSRCVYKISWKFDK